MRSRRLVALLLTTAAAACGRERAAPATASRDGGTLVIATPGDADLLLPPLATTQLAVHVSDRIFPRLAELKPELATVGDSGFTPSLARRWERRDTTTLVFHLDPRARWQDGAPIRAADVAYTFDVYRDSLTGSPFRANLDAVATVTADDSLTVTFRFRRAYPEQLYDAAYHLRILPKHLLQRIPHDSLASSPFAREPVGAGPFRFAHWERGAEIALEADTAYWLGRPHLDRIVWRVMPDVSAAVSALVAGEADAMEVIPRRDEIERAARAPDLRLVPYPSPFLAGLLFNTRRPPFDDRAVRRAVAMAVDRATVVQSIFGPYGSVPVGAVSPMQWIATSDIRQLPFDTAGAARLLDSLGWRRGADGVRRKGAGRLAFTVLVPTTSKVRQDAAVLVQYQLKAVGIALRIEPLEITVFDRRSRDGAFDALLFSRTLDPSPADLVRFWGHGSGNDNFGDYRSAAFDSLYALAVAARTEADAAPRWRRALEQINDDAPAVFLFSPRNQAAVHRRFADVSIRPDSWLASVATWSVPPDRRLPRDR